MQTQIINYVRAGYPGLYILSYEEQRVEAELKAVAEAACFGLHTWSITEGIIDCTHRQVGGCIDPLEMLDAFTKLPEKSILVVSDLHLFLAEPNPVLFRKIKDVLLMAKASSRVLIMVGCQLKLPPELEKELTVVEFKLPDREQLRTVLNGIGESARIEFKANIDAILDAASGLTTIEAENAFALSVVEARELLPQIVASEKAATIKKHGILEIIDATTDLDDIGGLELLKSWLTKRKDAFGERARQYGLPTPKGCLIIGIPGTGKSLTAKASANILGVPLLKLDAGKIFASLVGESERNWRNAIQTAEAVAPCVLWIDELEKGFGGSKSSGQTDGGTSARVFGSFLQWLQEKTAAVFVVATANDVSQLPPELLRKGRFDENWFVDLPGPEEREAIWRIQISRRCRKPDDYEIVGLAKASDGFTGAEIEALYTEALFAAFETGHEPDDLLIAQLANETVPLSKMMATEIQGLRQWAQGRARRASASGERKTARKLMA